MKSNEWKINFDVPAIPRALTDADYSPLLALVLTERGISTPEEAQELLSCDASCIHDPFLIKGMQDAVARIKLAAERKEKIAVYGDYDVDGITSTCLLSEYIESCGLECEAYIPNRNEEGYGLNSAALDGFKQKGISLVITVDCGITAIEEAKHAASLGLDLIITDHHECKPGAIPGACAVIDCKQPGDNYPFPYLAGVGMAFKLACACSGRTEEMLARYADLLAVGTVADVMPLTGENRYFVIAGLRALRTNPRPGIAAMLKEASVEPSSLSASTIGFTLAPRLNAAGRLASALIAKNLITTSDEQEAATIAASLCELNRKRQDIENSIWADAAKELDGKELTGPIVLASDKWNQGVIGIAASKLAERYSLPTIMIYLNPDDTGKGSCRSYGGFNLYDALAACSEHLLGYGGHALAAGLSIKKENLESFREALAEYYRSNPPEPVPEVACDLLITDASLLSVENVRSLEILEPFGNSNPKPLMCIQGAKVELAQNVGSGGRHLKLRVSYLSSRFDCILFSHTVEEFGITEGDIIDLAFTPQINEYRGNVSVQLAVATLRKHNGDYLCENILSDDFRFKRAALPCLPGRADFEKVWRALGKGFRLGDSLEELLSQCPAGMLPEVFCLCLSVFRDAGLLSCPNGKVYGSREVKIKGKADLDNTPVMRSLMSLADQ